MLKLELRHLGALLDALAGQGKVYAPFRQGGRTDFAWYDGTAGRDAAALDLEHHTARAPKDVLFPQVEDLLRFRQQGKKLGLEAAPLPTESVVAFGVRGCDTAGFAILDKVFLQDPADLYYRARRDSLTVLGLACGELEETCFCRTFGLDPAAPGGDVDLWLAGGALYWQARTDKGRRLTEALGAAVPFTDAADTTADTAAGAAADAVPPAVAAQRDAVHASYDRLPLAELRFDDRLYHHEREAFRSPVWESLAATCLTCRTCTYVCPTCHCFDVRDEKTAPATRPVSSFSSSTAGAYVRTGMSRFCVSSRRTRMISAPVTSRQACMRLRDVPPPWVVTMVPSASLSKRTPSRLS